MGGDGHSLNVSFAGQPPNTSFLYPNFLTFPSDPDIALNLTFLSLGVDPLAQCVAPPATGQLCTPAFASLVTPSNPLGLSPLNLENLPGGGSVASFAVAGQMLRISTGEISPYTGVYTTQFGVPYQFLLASMANGGSVTGTYSATFVTPVRDVPVPEPATLVLTAPAVFALYRRRRRR